MRAERKKSLNADIAKMRVEKSQMLSLQVLLLSIIYMLMLSVSQETIELEKHLPDKKKKQIKDKEDLKIKINEVLSAAFCSMLYTILYIPAPKSSKESVLRSHFISKRLCALGFTLLTSFSLTIC